MFSIAPHLPPPVRDTRGHAFAAAIDQSCLLEPFLACPAKTDIAHDAVLLELARQLGVAGPLWQAMIVAPNRKMAPMAGLPINVPSNPNEGSLAYPSEAQDTERTAPTMERAAKLRSSERNLV